MIIYYYRFASLFLSFLYTPNNFAERFNDTLIWYSFNHAPSNFTPSPSETLCAIVVASSLVFALDHDFTEEYLQFR